MIHKTKLFSMTCLALCAAAMLAVFCTEFDFSGHRLDPANNDNKPTMYTITFDANGGSGTTPNPQEVNAGTKITLPDGAGLERTGYTFAGWNVNSDGTGTNYDAGAEYTVIDEATLYARWTSTNIPVTSVTLYPTTLSLTVGGEPETLTATIVPSNATNNAVTWSSSDISVATVSNGVVTAVSAGTATITVTTEDGGKTAICDVTVSAGSTTTYSVTVIGGVGASGGGNYAAGVTVTINAGTPPDGHQFKNWTASGVTLTTNTSQTTFTMPSNAVTVTAVFETVNTGELCAGFTDGTPRDHFDRSKPQFCDERDGKKYVYVTIGGKDWMAENLNYRNTTGESDTVGVCYNNSSSNCGLYGRLYRWVDVMNIAQTYETTSWGGSDVKHQGICPSGWHVPSSAEWDVLTAYVGGVYSAQGDWGYWNYAGTKLKSTTGWYTGDGYIAGTDDFGFSALPGGCGFSGQICSASNVGDWWSATEYDATYAQYRFMHYDVDGVGSDWGGKDFELSLRCLRD